jgi:hypothetical protein
MAGHLTKTRLQSTGNIKTDRQVTSYLTLRKVLESTNAPRDTKKKRKKGVKREEG